MTNSFSIDNQSIFYTVPKYSNSAQTATNIVYNTEISIHGTETAGIADPSNLLPGWYYISTGSDKIEWKFYNYINGHDDLYVNKLNDIFCKFAVRAVEQAPFVNVYTRRKNDGRDATATYRSRFTYNNVDAFDGHLNQEVIWYCSPNGNSKINDVWKNDNTIEVEYNAAGSVGPQEEDEIIKEISLQTNSVAPAGDTEFILRKFDMLYNDQYKIEYFCLTK